jgi:Helix-turn-helix
MGIVSGFVLKLARQSAGSTQERLAEALGVDVSSVQGWESGRRPVAAMNAGEFVRLGARLTRLGAPSTTSRHLREALAADMVLAAGITAGSNWVDPNLHPLAAGVHRRTLTNLITWPFTGTLPPQLRELTTQFPRRGPVASQPTLGVEERTRFFDHLMTVAERGTHLDVALLRRQAVYLLGFDRRVPVADWLRGEWQRASRQPVDGHAVSTLMETRSASVALASSGDGTYLQDFVEGMSTQRAETANLNYWAYWTGDLADEETDDSFMFNDNVHSWAGLRLFEHLVDRLDPHSPHLPLNLCSLHSLVASRTSLLIERPDLRPALSTALDLASDTDVLTRSAHNQIAGLRYALRIAHR